MSSSEHERVAADLLDDFLRHPEAASLLADTRQRLLDGQVSTEYLAVMARPIRVRRPGRGSRSLRT